MTIVRETVIFAAALLLTAVSAGAAGAGPADVIKSRIAQYRELGSSFKNVNDELKSDTPQPMVLMFAARQILDVSHQQYGFFPAGSGAAAGVKTAARDEIWAQPAAFKTAQDNFAKAADNFSHVVAGGDMAAVRVAAHDLGQACAACHKTFRNKEE